MATHDLSRFSVSYFPLITKRITAHFSQKKKLLISHLSSSSSQSLEDDGSSFLFCNKTVKAKWTISECFYKYLEFRWTAVLKCWFTQTGILFFWCAMTDWAWTFIESASKCVKKGGKTRLKFRHGCFRQQLSHQVNAKTCSKSNSSKSSWNKRCALKLVNITHTFCEVCHLVLSYKVWVGYMN